jgi:diguanylate cyclase (GGDEF)-like protein/PAS domain S-box-containing protein
MPSDETSQTVLDSRLIEKFEAHRDFTRVFLDAFILINAQKRVLKFNQMFCTCVGLRAIDIRRANTTEDILMTEIPGSLQSAIELILEATGPIRIDEVNARKVSTDEQIQLIVSSYPYFDGDGKLLGACILMRDVTAESNLQGKYKEKTIQSITDPLTGLFTRRFFEDWLDKEIESCRLRNAVPDLGVLMFDLDKFKNVNDTYGHQAGDFVLSETAKVLRENSRKTDILGRYGGEELLVLLLGSSARGCCIAAEKFRQAIQNHEFYFDGKLISVTASVGVSLFLNAVEGKAAVVERADKCLYAAKRNGRNVVYANFGKGEVKANDFLGNSEIFDRKEEV